VDGARLAAAEQLASSVARAWASCVPLTASEMPPSDTDRMIMRTLMPWAPSRPRMRAAVPGRPIMTAPVM